MSDNWNQKPDDKQVIEGIRQKYVGSAAEHEALARLAAQYSEAYDRGQAYGLESVQSKEKSDAEAVSFARVLTELSYPARRFIFWDQYASDSYGTEELLKWFMAIGRTPEQLRKMADALEKAEAANA